MIFVLASRGTRGDVEPCAAVGLELLRRGHQWCEASTLITASLITASRRTDWLPDRFCRTRRDYDKDAPHSTKRAG